MLQSRRNFIKTVSLAAIATSGVGIFLKKFTKAFGPYNFDDNITDLIDCAFRLTDHNSLLNLEFYFINCSYDPCLNKVWAKYGPHENYMIVRLPQQHIAEKNFEEGDKDFRATTFISGYSYLVFRILFNNENFLTNYRIYGDGEYSYIDLTKEELLNWGNEGKFRLVVRQDLTESLFDLVRYDYYYNEETASINKSLSNLRSQVKTNTTDSLISECRTDSILHRKTFLENHYPFQTYKHKSTDKFNIKLVPKVYGDPITAIELPWRLIISPKLPDSSRFKFKWEIPDTDLKDGRHKLWTVTLSIKERDDEEYIDKKNAEKEKNKKDANEASTGSLNDVINQLELMILGSPDYPNPNPNQYNDILPRNAHRNDLVALYIKLKILARTEKLTLSAIGATVKLHLKNDKIEDAFKQRILVIEWNQVISLGRDEKVEVSTLFLEAEFGHKMAYVEIAERKLKSGVYVLIKTPYIIPLDITKDYTNHITQNIQEKDDKEKPIPTTIISRFNAPFKKITFLETGPKPLINKSFDQYNINLTETSFEFEAIDWHDNIVKFKKEINALPFGAVVDFKEEDSNGQLIVSERLKAIVTDTTFVTNATSITDNVENPILSNTKGIPFYKTKTLNGILKDTYSTSKYLSEINDSLRIQDSLNKKFNGLITQSFTEVPDNTQLESIEDWLEKFIQIYKSNLDNNFKKGLKNFNQIITDIGELDKSRIIESLSDKYLFQSQNFKQILQAWLNYISKLFDTVDGFMIWLSDYQKKEEFNDQDESIPKIISEKLQSDYQKIFEDKVDQANRIVEFLDRKDLKKSVQEWQQCYYEMYDSTTTIKTKSVLFSDTTNDLSSYSLYNFIELNSPELRNIILNLKRIQDNSNLQELISNIKRRIKIIYEIEEKAKQIPSLILLQKQKIGYAIQEKFDDIVKNKYGKTRQDLIEDLEDATGQVKKSLSELESEYIIFNGGLRQTEDELFDFFHDYAIIPQVAQAKVYVSALNKLVNEDLPISINYARDYLENQVNEAEFEVKQNAAMVFAQVQQYSREQVKGLIQKIGEKMPGFNVEIPAHYLTLARNPDSLKQKIYDKLKKDLGDTFGEEYKKIIQDYSRDIIFISEDLKNAVKVMDDLRNADPKKYFKDLGAKLFGSIGLEDILDVGFDIPRMTELPDKIVYQVSTDKFKNFTTSFVQFIPHLNNKTTMLELFISKNIKNVQEYFAYTQLNNFSIGVIIGGTEVLTVIFDQFKITSSPNQPKKTDVSITEVKLGGPLEFIAELAKRFMAPGNGMRIKPGPRSLSVDYSIVLPDIAAPAFNFRNLQMVIGVNIPYDPSTLKAISFTFGVNKPEDKFLVSAGIYGGRGHFMLRATPKGIEQIDIAIELGAYASLDLGIGKGEVFLFFGFWFVCGKDNDDQNIIKAVAYVICAGSATVLGFISIGVSVLIALTYIKRGQEALFYGEAVVTYSVKIAFFKKEFSIRYYKEIAGSSSGNGSTSLQEGSIMPDLFSSEGDNKTNSGTAKGFTDIFKDEEDLREYLSCFA